MDNSEMRVTKRNGELEDIAFDKILNRIKKLGQEVNIQLNYSSLAMKVIDQLYDKIETTKIDELAGEQCASLSTQHPDYGILASRIVVSNHQKSTDPSFYYVMRQLYFFKNTHGDHAPLISKSVWEFIEKNVEALNYMVDSSRDYLIDYFGFKTLERAYLFKIGDTTVERIQHMWLRVAVGIHYDNESSKNEESLALIKESYDLLSQKYFTHATPTLFNAGTPRPQLSSCFLIAMEDDSLEGIYNTLKDCAMISKWAGGIGLHIHNIRGKGTHIQGTNGKSNGLVPMLRVFNNTARFVDQGGGKRNGSFAIYLEPWHPDIEDFLELRKNHGDEELKARDLFYALWVPDLFMQRVKDNEKWSLFCPHKCPGLQNVFAESFVSLYETYEKEGKASKIVNARELWFKILDAQMETGTPYLLFKDAANKKSNQKNIGPILSSNLCVAPETLILTDEGNYEIQSLEGKTVNIWNGSEWSKTTIYKTGENQRLLEVTTSDGCTLHCTPYHKFYIQESYSKNSIKIVEAKDLKQNDKLIKCEFPVIDYTMNTNFELDINNNKKMKYAYTHGFFCGDGTYNQNLLNEKTPCNFKAINGHSYCKRHIDYENNNNEFPIQTTETNNICKGISYATKPLLSLYGEKKELIPYLDYRSIGKEDAQGRLNLCLPLDIDEKFFVPFHYSLKDKLEWFSGYCDADGCIARNGTNEQLQISCIHKDFLFKIKLMLQTCGINAKVTSMRMNSQRLMPDSNRNLKLYECKELSRLLITSIDLKKLVDLGFTPRRLKINSTNIPNRNANQFVKIVSVLDKERISDTYCFNEPKKHMGIFNGILTGQCCEIIQYSDDKETAVCNLASIGLPTFVNVETKQFDYEKLHKVTKVITNNLNKVIDINFYPTDKTKRSNLLHRPIGIGVQGLADTFILMDVAFHSEEAKVINKNIFETIYHAALEKSNEIAGERKNKNKDKILKIKEIMQYQSSTKILEDIQDLNVYGGKDFIYSEIMKLPFSLSGSYSSFQGSPASKGLLQFDLWDSSPDSDSGRYDWSKLKESIKTHGLRNSLLVAPMPTASTSQILGFNECFEPFTSNLYSRRTLAGEFVVVNKYLMKELIDLGYWNEKIKNNIIANKGSIQQLDFLPEHTKNKYKIVWEMPMKHVIDMAADRGAFICQSQSMNLWVEDPTYHTLTSMHFYSWAKGLKTGIYYLRRKGKHQAQQFTIEPEKKSENNILEEEVTCEMCSG
jgi:ribonucleoside-diphosphate reductase alpha chain